MAGQWSYYQWTLLSLLAIPGCLTGSWIGFSQVFVVASPSHWCHPPINLTDLHLTELQWKNMAIPLSDAGFSSCKQYEYEVSETIVTINRSTELECSHGWTYDRSLYDETLVTEMGLVCGLDFWAPLSMIIFNSGSVVGSLLFGHIADRYGRKKALFLCVAMSSLLGFASSAATGVKTFTALRFFAGFTFPSTYTIAVILAFEFVGDDYRIRTNTLFGSLYGASMCALGIVANYVRNWRLLLVTCSMPGTLFLFCWWFIPESPRWLISKRQYVQATDTLAGVAIRNRNSENIERIKETCRESFMQDDKSEQKPTVLDLFKTPILRKITLLITFVWLVNSTVYNGLLYNVPNMKLNDYINFALSGAVEVPAALITWPLMNKIGRRWSLVLSMGFGGLTTLLVPALANVHKWAIGILATIGKFAITASYDILYAYANELYPTTVRAIGITTGSLIAMICVMLEPYVLYATSHSRTLPLIIMGILSSIAALLALLLPETKGCHLPQTIEQMEKLQKPRKGRRVKDSQVDQLESLVAPS
ncbi:organic cation transporter 1 [Trichuris trichiura]|uniref:Organic cation transporter 1 n=1 Tax=Trichuris trichiura TaxID=36087 RepID=A0A077Z2R9_TRITR|nr:organic cation transporter 1 [Trichuris trichiura]